MVCFRGAYIASYWNLYATYFSNIIMLVESVGCWPCGYSAVLNGVWVEGLLKAKGNALTVQCNNYRQQKKIGLCV